MVHVIVDILIPDRLFMSVLIRMIEQHWQKPKWYLTALLWPLSRLFQAIAAIRRWLYRTGILKTTRLPCPVIVVGNIHAGGVGKTPIVAALVRDLQAQHIHVGIISRGYGRESRETLLVNEHSQAKEVGDEPLMLYRQTGAPVAVGRSRLEAAKKLLTAKPEIQLLISDDGLQHYALARDIEIVVFPMQDQHKQLDLLPNGPLRESVTRLSEVDAMILSQNESQEQAIPSHKFPFVSATIPCITSKITYSAFYCLQQPNKTALAADFMHRQCAAVAAIGRPERFFQALKQQGLVLCTERILPDHAKIRTDDWPEAEVVFITEKDAVKLTHTLADKPEIWVLPLSIKLEGNLTAMIMAKLNLPAV